MQAQEMSAISQVDGPGSLPMRDPIGRWMNGVSRLVEQDSSQGGTYVQRAPTTRRREYLGGNSYNDSPRGSHRDWRPPDREDILTEVGDPLTEEEDTLAEDTLMVEDPLEENILMEMGDPLEEEDTLVEDLLMEMEDLLMEGDPWTTWWTRTTWTSKAYNSTHPQVMLHMTALVNTFYSVGQSMLQLARA